MMNLLIIPMWEARHILKLWTNPWINLLLVFLLILTLLLLGLGLVGIVAIIMGIDKKKALPYDLAMLLVGIGLGLFVGNCGDNSAHNIGAAHNVIEYHQMQHLKKEYSKLPRETCTTSKVYNTNSIDKASKNRQTTKCKFSRSKAVKRYSAIKAKFKKTNKTRSLHPCAPRWYDYF